MLEQHGPNQVRSFIEHDYFYKRYDRALTNSLGFIRVVKTNSNCKVSGTKEITDIAMHCAAKLGKLDVLDELLNNKSVSCIMISRDQRLIYFGSTHKIQVYICCERNFTRWLVDIRKLWKLALRTIKKESWIIECGP
jgi:hypothetical protein